MFLPLIQAEMAIANAEDLLRLRELEEQGGFPAGYAARATEAVIRYLERIAFLSVKYRFVGPYPGPTVS